ncbi:hypothetical protein E3T26_03830 [Cryobacterium sp. TMT1-21]|uniref:hypothetical protein n=1 Tax=unclassified Cryobacterium TaxID=2649013 RepID=UPI00106AEC22|nr:MULTISPECIES: hypothetical protein [unclassified Cryobacterium]TFD16585.1 hypothetical protein E3T26_03830 [Cryobacterium sp. TMT1-21]TFD20898.1 hypothetical protein E3T42_00985 [Cryobacterium sp. TMT4-10]
MGHARTGRLVAFEWLVILGLVTGGVVFGVLGTGSADIDLPENPLDIKVGQSVAEGAPEASVDPLDRDVIVRLQWMMSSSGEVEINAFATSHAEARDPPFTIVLYCGARLNDLEGIAKNLDGTGIQDIFAAAAMDHVERGKPRGEPAKLSTS